MPSLLNTTVAANYNRMVPQDTYGAEGATGQLYSNFGTRKLRFIKVVATSDGSSALSFADTNATYTQASFTATGALTAFSVAVRALQTCAEVYMIGTPGSAGFVAAISNDTLAEADSGNSGTGYGLLEAAILASLKGGIDGAGTSAFCNGSGTVTVSTLTVGASNGITIA